MQAKIIIMALAGAVILATGIFIFSKPDTTITNTQTQDNVSIVDGKQIITIDAKGGYFPRITQAKANMPTVLKLHTQGTFDCSSAITIPSLGYRNNLPTSGETIVDVSPRQSGSSLKGICSMGMYSFAINFN